MNEDEEFFCKKCKKQLATVDEIAQGICDDCISSLYEKKDGESFLCVICEKKLIEMKEISQGICSNCKASIIRKIKA